MALGVHTAWGRTLKDVFQRYKAMRGFDQRYQNGFDCQGLWIEVGVERELGLNSKREIEEFGLAEFARRCRERRRAVLARSSREGSSRLGQWMDWGRDYFTFSDTNIEYIWRFLRRDVRARLALPGPPLDRVVPALRHVDLAARADAERRVPGARATRRSTSASRCSTARASRSSSGRRRPGRCPRTSRRPSSPTPTTGCARTASGSAVARYPDETFVRTVAGRGARRARVPGAVRRPRPGRGVEHRVIPWDDVSLEEGTGIVHIAPGRRPGGLRARPHPRPSRAAPRSTRRAASTTRYGWLHGLSTTESRRPDRRTTRRDAGSSLEAGHVRAPLPALLALRHAAHLPRRRTTGSSPSTRSASRCSTRTPRSSGRPRTWASAWTTGCATWATGTSRGGATTGSRCRSTRARAGTLTVIGSQGGARGARRLRARAARGAPPAVDRRGPDPLRGVRREVQRIPEVGDVWLDAGIVPFSTLGWESAEYVPEGYATGAAKGLTTADLPDHAYWEEWFPADWVSEMREQIRLWFYSQLFMSVALTGRAPYRRVLGYEKMLDENGREMHSSWGNTIDAQDAFARMGADVMRWQYCAQPPNQNLLFGFGPGARDPAAGCSRSGTRASSSSTTRTSRAGRRRGRSRDRPERRARAARPLARRADARARRRGDRGLRDLAHGRRRPRLRGVRRRRLELVHPPLAAPVLGRRPGRAADALVRARPGAPRRRAAHAVPHRSPLARADRAVRGRARVRPPRRLARAPSSRTRRCSPRSPSSAAWSSSGVRRARPRA